MNTLTYWRTFGEPGKDRTGQRTHLEGTGDSYTLCGTDTAGDDATHRKPPVIVKGKPRITCEHCQQIIELVRAHLKA